jgi:TPR repeat protein
MSGIRPYRGLAWAAVLVLISASARADLDAAAQAYEKKDFVRSFELYRELAELGRAEAQETLAVMYVNAEGVKRDNVLGYAWARLALEQGPHEAAQGIVAQLEPHLTDGARAKIAALQAQLGKEALQKSLLPVERRSAPAKCTMKSPVNPNDYYSRDLIKRGISGYVLVSTKIWSDGRAHDPRVEYSVPDQVFEPAGRAVGLDTGYGAHTENGVAVPCTIRFKVKFYTQGSAMPEPAKDAIDDMRKAAETGDPRSQLLYAYTLQVYPDIETGGDRELRWFLRAAQAGLPVAQFKIANALLGGHGVEQDEAKAAIWLDKAANGGNLDAQIALANYRLRDFSDSAAAADSVTWLGRASKVRVEARFYLLALLASHPDAAIRNPQRVLDTANEWLHAYDDNPIAYEIRAAAQAHLGDFAGAQKNQGKAIGLAKKLHWDTAPQAERLATYQANKAWTGDLFAFY